jgi:cysteinyl-tRNA synthetase
VTLQFHDTATRTVREFAPLTPGQVSVYLCGATVQAPPHIGHLRSAVCFDVLIRWLEASGYLVTFCRNVTDVEDKILRTAASEGVPPWIVAERNQRAFTWAYDAVGCRPPDIEPRATGHIPEMIVLMRRLIEDEHAYPAGGDVYFDVHSYPFYGALSGQRLDQMRPAEDSDDTGLKRDPRDFALWKAAKPGEPYWETPWGPGRPGWHLECSAMSTKYLGSTFDIHCGGMDLIFPHHENEIAQSKAAGDGFARYWLHNGLLGLAGEKMSKSLGNSLLVTDVLNRVRPVELRYYLVQAHYRSMLEFSEEALEEAVAAYQRIERFVLRAAEVLGDLSLGLDVGHTRPGLDVGHAGPGEDDADGIPTSFRSAMDDDLAVPAALAAVHACVRDGNQALAASDKAGARGSLIRLRAMLDVLGLDPLAPHWSGAPTGSGERLRQVVGSLVKLTLEQRDAARARRDYATADAIRDGLEEIGVIVEDAPQGPRWELKR